MVAKRAELSSPESLRQRSYQSCTKHPLSLTVEGQRKVGYLTAMRQNLPKIMPNDLTIEWTETRTNIQHPDNPIAIPTDRQLYKSTYQVVPFEDAPPPYPPGAFKACPGVYIEVIFRLAPVPQPDQLRPRQVPDQVPYH